jgi:hypothetical protein
MSLTPRLDKIEAGRNLIINGNFDFWQRGTSFPTIATGTLAADRFKYVKGGTAVHTVSRMTDVPTVAQSGFKSDYSLNAVVTTTDATVDPGDDTGLRYIIEGYDYATVHARPVRLQFWVKSNKIGAYGVFIRAIGAGAVDRSYVMRYTINAADTWELKTFDLVMDTSIAGYNFDNLGGAFIGFQWSQGSNRTTSTYNQWTASDKQAPVDQVNLNDTISNYWRISQLRLICGDFSYSPDSNTVFDRAGKTIQQELAMCQRYCTTFAAGASTTVVAMCSAFNTTGFFGSIPLPVEMRTPPTMTAPGGSIQLTDGINASITVTSFSIDNGGNGRLTKTVGVAGSVGAGLTAFRPYGLALTNYTILFDAEL